MALKDYCGPRTENPRLCNGKFLQKKIGKYPYQISTLSLQSHSICDRTDLIDQIARFKVLYNGDDHMKE